jgi:hypothetical protein
MDPNSSTKIENALYYALSRPFWVFACMCIIVSAFTSHWSIAKSVLSNGNLLLLAKLGPISALVVVLTIHLVFCSSQMQDGLYLTFPVALLFGLGFILSSTILALVLMFTVDFPLRRLYQITLMPYLSHDVLLAKWFISDPKFDLYDE